MRAYIAATGAGAGAQAAIWAVPGCSDVFAGATFPYGREQLEDFLGFVPGQFCSEETAMHMAMKAYYTAWDGTGPALGIGLSAAVASAAPRRGENRIHAAMMNDSGVYAVSIRLGNSHGAAARTTHGALADELILDLLTKPKVAAKADTEKATSLFLAHGYWAATGKRSPLVPPGRAMFPGAFNPPHERHVEMAAQRRAIFWVEAQAPNKEPLSLAHMLQRAKMLKGHDAYFTSGYPLYTDKSTHLPEREFIVGADAVLRMFDPKWGPTPEEVAAALEGNSTTLAVGGRLINGKYLPCEEAFRAIPSNVRVTSIKGRLDMSSSAIRAASGERL